jgi:predicted DNA-binding protein (MmcQ/YjbR family)
MHPGKVDELVEQEGIVPAAYVGRYKWVSFERLDVLPWTEVKDLIGQSYQMVAAKAKVTRRPRGDSRPRRSGGAKRR